MHLYFCSFFIPTFFYICVCLIILSNNLLFFCCFPYLNPYYFLSLSLSFPLPAALMTILFNQLLSVLTAFAPVSLFLQPNNLSFIQTRLFRFSHLISYSLCQHSQPLILYHLSFVNFIFLFFCLL